MFAGIGSSSVGMRLLAAVIGGLVGVTSVTAEDVRIAEKRTTYLDPEFWGESEQVVWQDGATFDIWLADIDPDTGAFIPNDGRGTLVRAGSVNGGDAASPWPSPLGGRGSFNGPEFGRSAAGRFVYFTVQVDQSQTQLARFGPLDGGTPGFQQLTTGFRARRGPLPTTFAAFSVGATLSLNGLLGPAWRFDDEPQTDRAVPIDGFPLRGPRWVPGELAVSTTTTSNGVQQAAIYDVQAETLDVLTDDAGTKSETLIFDSPELGKRALMCKVGRRELAIYEEAAPFWRKVWSVPAPRFLLGGDMSASIYYPGAFVHGGRTYVYFLVGRVEGFTPMGPSRVFLAQLYGQPRKISSPFWAWSFDPEVVVIGGKPFLYYYNFTGIFPGQTEFVTADLRVIRNFLP